MTSWGLALVAAGAAAVCWRTMRSARAWQREAALCVADAVATRHQAAAQHADAERLLRWARAVAREHEFEAALNDRRHRQ